MHAAMSTNYGITDGYWVRSAAFFVERCGYFTWDKLHAVMDGFDDTVDMMVTLRQEWGDVEWVDAIDFSEMWVWVAESARRLRGSRFEHAEAEPDGTSESRRAIAYSAVWLDSATWTSSRLLSSSFLRAPTPRQR